MAALNVVLLNLLLQKLEVQAILEGRISFKAVAVKASSPVRDKINAVALDESVHPVFTNRFLSYIAGKISDHWP
jgi:transcription antitermination factor NusA-like protein